MSLKSTANPRMDRSFEFYCRSQGSCRPACRTQCRVFERNETQWSARRPELSCPVQPRLHLLFWIASSASAPESRTWKPQVRLPAARRILLAIRILRTQCIIVKAICKLPVYTTKRGASTPISASCTVFSVDGTGSLPVFVVRPLTPPPRLPNRNRQPPAKTKSAFLLDEILPSCDALYF